MSQEITLQYALDEGAYAPEKAHTDDAGFDLRTPNRYYIRPHSSVTIDTGVHTLIPRGYVGMLKSKSGLNVKHSLTGEGVIDAGYTGSIVVKLYNNSGCPYVFKKGDKLIQLVLLPIPDVKLVECANGYFSNIQTDRGDSGFGSTGK